MHSNVTSKNVSGFTLAGPPCIVGVHSQTSVTQLSFFGDYKHDSTSIRRPFNIRGH